VCLVSNNSNCASVYITVQNSSVSPLNFSQSSVTLYSSQSVSVTINGGSGSYYIANNSGQNQGAVVASISGSTVTLTTTSTTGSASITICSTDNSSCGIINVSIGTGNSTAVTFSQSSPTVTVGQSVNVSIYGPSGSLFYVASNSNPSIVQPNLSSSTLTLLGIANGTSNISICASVNNCGTVAVTVNTNSGATTNSRPFLSEDTVSVAIGQVKNINLSGGNTPYSIYSSSSNIFQSVLSNNVLVITGLSVGSGAMNVCSSSGSCSTLSVSVTNQTPTTTTTTGCTSTTMFSPVTGIYCAGIYVPSAFTNTNTDTSNTTETYKFTKPLKIGSTGEEVKELQKKLKDLGYYKGKIDGGFGPILEKAVKAYQKAHGLQQLGNVGPGTRAMLNKE
jgi:hypothetical protein